MRRFKYRCKWTAALAAAAALWCAPAWAVFSGDMSPRAESGDADYAAAIRSNEAEDWPAVIEHLKKVVARRPWHDNAHTLLGYSYRRLGDYDSALKHYAAALDHNPRHRGAIEYLGVTYLHMGQPQKAYEMKAKLAKICRNVALTFSDGDFGDGCEEYEMLEMIIEVYEDTGEVIECE